MTIVVTGLGAITALGETLRATFDRVLEGERGFADVTIFDPGDVRGRVVGEVRSLPATAGDTNGSSRTTELALLAAREAIADANLDPSRVRTGLLLAGSTAGLFQTETELVPLLSPHPDAARVDAALARMPSHLLTGPTDYLAAKLGPFVRVRSLSSACSSGINAIAIAAEWLELGLVDAVLCGGADALCRVTLSGFNALAAVDPQGARPFDRRRKGLTLGEGAGLLVLERAEDAAARKQRAICTVLGWAARSEAHHITNPEPTGDAPLRAMRAALARAGLATADVDYVNAHGTGTPLNDPMETRALVRLFGESDVGRVAVSTQKGMIGHTLAAAGAIETAIAALAIERGVIPPTGGLEEVDPECAPLRHVLRAETAPIRALISSSFGFGGMDAAVVLGTADRVAPPRPPRRDVVITGCAAVTPAGIFAGRDAADLPATPLPATRVTLPDGLLDADRARRLDPVARLATVACARALDPIDREAGIILGNAFGLIDATAELMKRFEEKGARMVRPADFPGLVPSSPAGHVSIYLGLRGPSMIVADHAVSGECAFATAFEMVAAGDAERICAGGSEDRSPMIERYLTDIFGEGRYRRVLPGDDSLPGPGEKLARAEGAGFVALAPAGTPGALARVAALHAWTAPASAPELAPPPPGAVVVVGTMTGETAAVLDRSSWASCERFVCAPATGAHEAAGAIAIVVAAAKVARGDAPAALFLGIAGGRGYAGMLWPVSE